MKREKGSEDNRTDKNRLSLGPSSVCGENLARYFVKDNFGFFLKKG